MDRIDCLVIGAGVVGLAAARALALAGRDVVIIEAADAIGTGASSRNSEVIHAGIYYAPGSRKASLCVRGRDLLYAYCEAQQVTFQRCGKLIVAVSDADRAQLDTIAARAAASGVHSLVRLTRDEARAMEPEVECVAALWSPDTGIVDSHGLMEAYLHDAEAAGGMLALQTAFATATRTGDAWQVTTTGHDAITIEARWIVNCAGLDAQAVARGISGFPDAHIPTQHVAKGHYFSLAGASPFSRLVYPTPTDGGLGIHLTLDLGGQARFGPDVEWLADPTAPRDYAVDVTRADAFAESIRRYWPGLPDGALQPGYTGIRAKLSGPGQPAADFRIDGPDAHSVPGIVQCFGIESPGLTASLAIAEQVVAMVHDQVD
jgi:L-2-hydroxyglutarate oxidase LhgO